MCLRDYPILNLDAPFVISGNIQGMNSTIAVKNVKEGE
jgi:hypothetical protein